MYSYTPTLRQSGDNSCPPRAWRGQVPRSLFLVPTPLSAGTIFNTNKQM